jgi:hypothetical protein
MASNDFTKLLFRYVRRLSIPLGANYLNARNHVESAKEEQKKEDDKIISLRCPFNSKKRMKKNKWRKNGVATHLQLPTMVTHKFL